MNIGLLIVMMAAVVVTLVSTRAWRRGRPERRLSPMRAKAKRGRRLP